MCYLWQCRVNGYLKIKPRTLTLNAGMVRQRSLASEALKSEKSEACGILIMRLVLRILTPQQEVLCEILLCVGVLAGSCLPCTVILQ